MLGSGYRSFLLGVFVSFGLGATAVAQESWTQYKFDSRHSGNAADRAVATPLGLIGAVPATDAILTAPVVAGGRVYVVDASGTAICIDAESLEIVWRKPTAGGTTSSSTISSPALAGKYLHFGTAAGVYHVLDAATGESVRRIAVGEPIFSAPVVSGERVYFATLGSRVHALAPDGEIKWTWDYVKERMKFEGDRWSGADWARHKGGKLGAEEQFACAWNLAAHGKTLVLPAGGAVVWLEDRGDEPGFLAMDLPRTPTYGLSLGEDGTVYRQWHRLDNGGQVDILRLKDGKVEKAGGVPGSKTSTRGRGLLSFGSVSLRGKNVYRTRVQDGMGLCAHPEGTQGARMLHKAAAIAPPVLLKDQAIYGDLQGNLHVVPLSGEGEAWSFRTAFGKAVAAPAAVADGRIYFGCDDGYLYVLGPDGKAPLPERNLELWRMKNRLTAPKPGREFDRVTAFGDFSNKNVDAQGVETPFKMRWIRRFEGSTKHFSTFGGGRMYTHTSEGQVFAVEQETGRLLWRTYHPGVHMSYTAPLYHNERLIVPQAGLDFCRMRCFDAATGKLLWEAPFAGSPSWNRQLPPVVHKNLVIYQFSTGKYGDAVPEGRPRLNWLFGHQRVRGFPDDFKPMVRAYNLDTGKTVWERDFSEYGNGGDEAGLCLMDGKLFYSAYFGRDAQRKGKPGPKGITAALDPENGNPFWVTTDYSVHGGCTISGRDGRLYLGGYNPEAGTEGRHVWCLDAKDGKLIWKSDPLIQAIQVVTVGERFVFIHAQYRNAYLLDKETGKVITQLAKGYKCTRFSFTEPYLLASNLDILDLTRKDGIRLVSTGPRVDPSECVGSVVSNGRLYFTGQGGGLQVSLSCGEEATSMEPPWIRE